ncbi:MAG: winged helix-turn-helix domain-containing protein [Armatimonadetes bacterium]|nr:winged helix-turn-helix domain-containing protein [Armatimonadota bacterium]
MLNEVGAPVVGTGGVADVLDLISTHSPVIVVLDATSSLADLPVVAGNLTGLPPVRRPALVAVVAPRLLGEVDPSWDVDELIIWPAGAAEVELRVGRARWRRLGLSRDGLLRSGELVIDTRRHAVFVEAREVDLTVREYELLNALVRSRGRLLTRDYLLEQVWGPDYFGGARTVDIHIRRLRAKLPEIEHRIVTVRGYGYRLADPEG